MQRHSAAAIRQSTTADELIRLNRDLLAVAEHARRNSRELVHRSSMGRIQRCLSGVHRNPFWALGMAEWVAGVRTHPPRGGGRTRGDGTFLSWRETNPGGRVHALWMLTL
jgi:hypothetical protein